MAIQSKETIKSYFETGDAPTQSDFEDFIDSYADTARPTLDKQLFTTGDKGQIYIGNREMTPNNLKLTDIGATWNEDTNVGSAKQWRSVSISSDGKYQTAVVYNGQIYTCKASDFIDGKLTVSEEIISQKLTIKGTEFDNDSASNQVIYMVGSTESSNNWTAVESDRLWVSVSMSSDGRYQTAVVFGGQIYTTELFSLLFQYDIPEAKTIILNSESLALVDYTFDIASWQYKVIAQNNGVVSEIVKIRDMNDGSEKTADVWYEGNMLDETLGDTKLFFNLVNDTINIYVRSVDKTKFNTNVTIQQLLGKSQQGYS